METKENELKRFLQIFNILLTGQIFHLVEAFVSSGFSPFITVIKMLELQNLTMSLNLPRRQVKHKARRTELDVPSMSNCH